MPISYRIDPTSRIVYRTHSGTVTYDDFADHWRKLLNDPELPTAGHLLLAADMREATIQLNGDSIRSLVKGVILPLLDGRKWLSAIVVRSTADFGTTRQFSIYSQECGETSVFYNMEEAVSWLFRQGESQPLAEV